MNNTKIKTYTFALVGLILFSSGLCLFGESIIFKYESKDWFFTGTISLILIIRQAPWRVRLPALILQSLQSCSQQSAASMAAFFKDL